MRSLAERDSMDGVSFVDPFPRKIGDNYYFFKLKSMEMF